LNLHPGGKLALVGSILAIVAIGFESTISAHLLVKRDVPLGEAPLFRDDHLLATGVLELGTSESLNHVIAVVLLDADRHHDLIDANACHGAERLTISASHSSLQPIGASTGQHLVDAQHVERMESHSHVERILAACLYQVLVGANSSRL